MNILDEKYYDGYEGEPEITFTLLKKDGEKEQIGIWDGYFNAIMKKIKPKEEGWTALAYYYNLYTGWYDKSPWPIENLEEAYEQLTEINKESFEFIEEREVLIIILNMLREALDNNYEAFISYD